MKNKLKKSLSLIMTVLMVLSCWVWVAPTEAEAATSNYTVRIYFNIGNGGWGGAADARPDGSNITISYISDNGTGTETSQAFDKGQLWSSDNVSGAYIDCVVPGWPSSISIQLTNSFAGDVDVVFTRIEINGRTAVPGNYSFSGGNTKSFTPSESGTTGSVYDTDSEKTSEHTGWNWPKPKPTTIEGLGGTTTIVLPEIDKLDAIDVGSFTAKAYDQYGVEWYNTPSYNLSSIEDVVATDINDEESGLWWELSSDMTTAHVKASAVMQDVYSVPLKNGNTRDFYLVAQMAEADGAPVDSQKLHFVYPKYDWAFYGEVLGLNDHKVSIFVEDKTTDETKVYAWDGDDQGTEPDAQIVVPDYLAYNQKSLILPMYAEKDGFTFYGFWTKPQPSNPGEKGEPFSPEASFAEPVDSDTYLTLPEDLYTDAGEQWNYRTDGITTGNKTYYAWWLANDVSVKFYDVDGSYIDSFSLKAGQTHQAIVWPEPAAEYKEGYTNGAFTYTKWTEKWVNIDGEVVDPTGYTFGHDLILTPQYESASFDKTHKVTFYNSDSNIISDSDYNYRDVAVVPAVNEVSAVNKNAKDYSYEFVGWSSQVPTTGLTYHVMLEDVDYDVGLNPVYIAEDFVVRSDATYYPVFRRYAKPYDVVFVYANEIGNFVDKTVQYKYGQKIEIPEEVPESYAMYGLEFTILGWQENAAGADIVLGEEICEGATSYVARYDNGVQKPYNVSYVFRNEAGELITKTAEVYEGYSVEQSFIDALKPSDTYDDGTQELRFNGSWICSANGNTYGTSQLAGYYPANHVTFTAVYTDGVPFRTVTYVDGDLSKEFRITDGTQLPYWTHQVDTAEGTVTETYVPSKANTEFGIYEFAGWFDEVQTDETATNGTQYKPGETAIGADVTLYPQFIYKLYNYNFVFKNWDGTVLKQGTFHLGDSLNELRIQAENIAVRPADETYTYQFLGWDKRVPEKCEGGEPDSTLTFIAQYKPVYIYYNVEWYNDEASMNDENGLPVATSKYVYGAKMHTPSVTLTVPESDQAGQNYVFAGWYYKDANGNAQPFVRNMTITGDMKFYATYALTAKMHKVTVNDGTNTYTLTVEDGANIKDLVSDPVAGYVNETTHNGFRGWLLGTDAFDIENATITKDITIVADFEVGQHVYDKSEIVTLPTYPVAGYTDYDGTVVPATTGEGLKRFWCECNKEKTGTTDKDKIPACVIPALKDEVDPGSTAYIGTANWSDFDAAAAADTIYANPNTDFIITTSDKGNVDNDYNATGKGIGVQQIKFLIAPAESVYSEEQLSLEIDSFGTVAYDWPTIQTLLIKNYGGWAYVPEMYKDYNANFTAKLGSYNLTDGEAYVIYAKVLDKANNMSFIRTAEFIYDATKPVVDVAGNYNAAENTYCEQATITVTEATDYVVTVDGTPISETTANKKYNIGEGVHQVVVTDKAGNKTSVFFTVLKEHTLVNYNEAPDCLTAGFTSQRCLNCGADFNKEDVPELGHELKTVLVNATCDENGYTITTCGRCDMEPEINYYTLTGELIEESKGHAWNAGVVVKAATCQTKGVKIFTCSVCGETKQEEIAPQADAHNFYKPQVVKPTCTEAGKVTQLCRVCGEKVTIAQGSDETAANYDAEYAPTGHTPDKWIVTEAARCFARGTDAEGKEYFGVETNVCSVCDTVITDENGAAVTRYIYDAIPHTWIVDEANSVEPAVGVEGKIAYKCAVEGCPGTKEPTKIDALVEYSITFIGTTVVKVTDEETGEVTLVEQESKQVDKGLPGETAGNVLHEQKKLDSADGKVAYVFDGWYTKKADGSFDKKYTTPMEIGTENITLYAKFKEKDIFYTVDFEIPSTYTPATEEDEEVYGGYKEFKSLMGAIGDERTPGEEPVFAETDYFKFTFDGWYTKGTNPSKYDGKIAGDATYQAAFKAEAKKYTVIFMSDGVVFDTEDVVAGATAVPSEGTPEKASDAQYHYTFKGWYTSTDGRTEADLTDITEKTTVYAVYTAEAHDKGTSGTVKQEANCKVPEITEYTCADCGYVWTEITKEALDHVAGDPVYNEETGKNEIHCTECGELLSEAEASYTIKFEDHNGRRLDTITVKVNNKFVEQAEAAAKLASKASDDKNDYTFAGWIVKEGDTPVASKDLPAATANVTYIAAYTATARTFSVTFATSILVTGESVAKKTFSGIAYGKIVDKDGNDVTKYAFDKDVFGIPESDSKVHYVFKGWDVDLSKGVTKDTLVRPVYEAVSHSFDSGVPSAADCTQSGGYKYTCSECGYYYISGNIPALGHNYVTKVVKEPTYKEEGLAVKTCQRCGDTIEEKLPVKQYIVVKVTVKDTDGKAYHGAKVEITHDGTGKVYGPNLTDTNGVATFYVEQSGEYFVRVLEIPGHEGGYSGDITVNENGDITNSTLPTLKGEGSQSCSCGCHRNNFWGMLFRFFHKIIKLLTGRYICCDCPDSRY
ncbi:MAG: InlB B-repeat-containing protein [Clostridia bacterium]|nr:InlB B-repeat-containing protein [Clostridia bacterium]